MIRDTPSAARLRPPAMAQGSIWLALWAFWVWAARHNHPTLSIDAAATALLVAACAAAVYFNWLVLVPRLWKPGHLGAYWAALLLATGTLAIADAWVISKAYDILWGPDPARFGFWVNVGLEFVGIGVHLIGAAIVMWAARARRRRAGSEA